MNNRHPNTKTYLHTFIALIAALISAQLAFAQSPSRLPQFQVDDDWPNVPAQLKLGDPSSFAVDSNDNVYMLHRPHVLSDEDYPSAAPPVVVFDPAGEVINTWGGNSADYQWPQREHFIHIDYQDNVWIGGNYCPDRDIPRLKPVNDDQILKFSTQGEFLLQIGLVDGSGGNADTLNLHQPADVAIDPDTNEVFVADGYGNHRVIVFDATTGAYKRLWGAFGNSPEELDQCPPPALRTVPPGAGPDQFSIVHAIRISHDGLVYVADRENRRVQVYSRDGDYIQQLIQHETPFARNLALSADPQQKYLYVGNGSDITIVERRSMTVIGSIAPEGMVGSGHQIATDSKGNIYIAASRRGMQKLVLISD
ncbi:MAG: hypothetical protein JKY98_08745 [Gammaproteobacteria bacterium]|nr:hypothetical protein [Gammaproteobacteria bacterium]